jgi:quercetin dioxygenase-like cupin family protein
MLDQSATRAILIEDALRSGGSRNKGVPLVNLLELMRERSAEEPYLSSIYFAGAEGDHPYFLLTDKFAAGISVLPQDLAKASKWKRHPHQTEVLFVLDGELIAELRQECGPVQHRLRVGDVLIIPPGTCHRVLTAENREAAYLFAKSNPVTEPRSEDC